MTKLVHNSIAKSTDCDIDADADHDHDHDHDPSYSVNKAVFATTTTVVGRTSSSSSSPLLLSLSLSPKKAIRVPVVPALAFGLYKVPNDDEGVRIILDAILRAGYRHFDSASIYGNETTFGKALALVLNCCMTTAATEASITTSSSLPTTTTTTTQQQQQQQIVVERSELFIASKVWNDAQKEGRIAVRRSVEQSLDDLGLDYLDICYVHWPVPGYFVDTYRELMLLQTEGKIRFLGISNFRIADYEELLTNIPENEFVPPLIHQFEISPFMYRPKMIQYFQNEKNILVAASKALNRASFSLYGDSDSDSGNDGNSNSIVHIIQGIAESYSVTPAQVLLRWSFQKGLIVLSKTSSLSRMKENRALFGSKFSLSPNEMEQLDGITTEEVVRARDELEAQRRR